MGTDDEFREFVLARYPSLLRSAQALTGDPGTAEDLVQNALIRTYASWARVKGADDPYAYSHKILFTTFSRMRRRHRVAETLRASVDPSPQPAGMAASAEDRDQLYRALQELPPRYRAVLVLRFYEDRSVEEVAVILGCSANTVKTQTARALERLRVSPQLDQNSMGR